MTSTKPSNGPHVLVVEDEPLVMMGTVASLEELGCVILEASRGDEAIECLGHVTRLDMLVTDIQMPGSVDGLELAHFVRKRWPDAKIVLCSGRIFPPKSILPQGARFMAKPYYHDDLVAIAREARMAQ